MLKTCLKHDLRALMRLWWILGTAIGGISLLVGGSIRIFAEAIIHESDDILINLFAIAAVFIAFGGFMALCFGGVATTILIYWRMYTHFYTDQGYLTFTLPVKRSTQYLSKVLAGLILNACTMGCYVVGIALIFFVGLPPEAFGTGDLFELYGEIFNIVIKGAFEYAGVWVVLWTLLAILLLVVMELVNSAVIYFCITLGAVIVKKYKLLAGIGVYYVFNIAVTIAAQFLAQLIIPGMMVLTALVLSTSGFNLMALAVTAALLILLFFMACVATTIHFITVGLLERRLNLA